MVGYSSRSKTEQSKDILKEFEEKDFFLKKGKRNIETYKANNRSHNMPCPSHNNAYPKED
jgi:hypothetical protein